MRKIPTNAAYGSLDRTSRPVGMLLLASIVLHELGGLAYGLWIAAALNSANGIVASAFCGVNFRCVAHLSPLGNLNFEEATL